MQGNKMYGEIHVARVEKFREKLTEGNLCMLKDFFVNSAKNMYKAVEGSFMIKITPWSKVEVQKKCACWLSSLRKITPWSTVKFRKMCLLVILATHIL